MTQENKDLLLKDLCARLPYSVEILADTDKDFESGCVAPLAQIGPYKGITRFYQSTGLYPYTIEEIRPYLFPLSSMTEEQYKYISYNFGRDGLDYIKYGTCDFHSSTLNIEDIYKLVDWLNKNHFDYRGLIEKGLAIDATGLNIY